MNTCKIGKDGFYVRWDGTREHVQRYATSGTVARYRFHADGVRISAITGRAWVEGGIMSASLFAANARSNGKSVGRAAGFTLRKMRSDVSSTDVYEAADQVGDDEVDAIASLLTMHPSKRLFAGRTLLVPMLWEGESDAVARTLRCVARHFHARTVALHVDALKYDPPQPDEPAENHAIYRAALQPRVEFAEQLGRNLGGIGEAFIFCTAYERTHEERLATLGALSA